MTDQPFTESAEVCDHCGQRLPHVGTSWSESGACRRNEFVGQVFPPAKGADDA